MHQNVVNNKSNTKQTTASLNIVSIKSGTVNAGCLPARSLTQYEPGVLVLLCKKDFLDHDPSVEITKVAVNSYIYSVHLLGDALA